MATAPILQLHAVSKAFTMHLRGSVVLPVFEGVSLAVNAGECVVLAGPSGIGKSSILKMVYGNYRTDTGAIHVHDANGKTDIATADPRTMLTLRKTTIGYVSQFLRVIPRVSALDVVAEPAIAQGRADDPARADAKDLLARLNVPEKLWALPPATFSGGEQQRVNIARGFITTYPLLLLDEPTASLDAANSAVVAELIAEKKAANVAMLGIFHDPNIREKVADRLVDVGAFAVPMAA
ncbi:MAG: phosphonate C-P lyase system protein PhnL [Pseudomonadota bacterium]